jgi:catechol 2,3-dioxygenase-like lactoylglutathione lyase family enzyme
VTVVWYQVRDLEAARAFWTASLGFEERYFDEDARWVRLERAGTQVALAEGEPEEGGVALIDVPDAKAEAERLRAAGAEVGTVLELHGAMRIVDVFDQDGNRLQLAEELT